MICSICRERIPPGQAEQDNRGRPQCPKCHRVWHEMNMRRYEDKRRRLKG